MNDRIKSQSNLIEFYEDLDIVLDLLMQVKYNPGRPAPDANFNTFTDCGDSEECEPETTILTVNGTEIEVDSETANKIFEAAEVKIKSKMKQRHDAAMLDIAIEKYEDKIMRKGA